jgi:hypothetical protein
MLTFDAKSGFSELASPPPAEPVAKQTFSDM